MTVRRRSTARLVVIIGRGRMGGAFARALTLCGVDHVVLGGRSRGMPKLDRRGRRVTWVLAVTDTAITPTAEKLVGFAALERGDVVVHLAGKLGPGELAPASRAGIAVAAVHPLVAVASPRKPPSLAGSTASFDGDRAALPAVRALADAIGLRLHVLHDVDRTQYHAAAALVATGSIALAQAAGALFRDCAGQGATDTAVREFVASLLASAAHNVRAVGADHALASPLLRGDTAAVEGHLATMKRYPRAAALYVAALAQVVDRLAAGGKLDASVIRRARAIVKRHR